MSEARAEILGRVKAALATAALPMPEPSAAPRSGESKDESLIARFTREAVAVGCVVHGPVDRYEVLPEVVSILREAHAHELLAWGAPDLPIPGLGDALIQLGFQFLDPVLPQERSARAAQLARLDPADVGLTGALAGLADTGTLVLASGAERPRLAYLLPPIHIAILPSTRIVEDLAAFLGGHETAPAARATASLALVTGPSRSGDIEMILTRGVHGPGVVHVVLFS